MSAAAAAAEAPEAPKGGGKKKLIIIIAAVLLLVLIGGGAAFFLMKKNHAADAEGEGEDAHAAAPAATKIDPKKAPPPVFLPLDPFTVNLADKEAERYAQVGITFELDEAKTSDMLKAYMPAIRNNILMLLSHKQAAELQTREGKERLMKEIRHDSLTPLGIEVAEEDDDGHEAEAADGGKKPAKKKKAKKAPAQYPIKAVHFSNIIIQ